MNKISFTEIIHTIKTYEPQPSSWWSGKKVYLGYSDQKGWAIYELGLWDRLCRNLFGKYEETRLEYIEGRIRALPLSEIEAIAQDHDAFYALLTKTPKILMEVMRIGKKPTISAPTSTKFADRPAAAKHDSPLTTYIETLLKSERAPLKPVEFPVHLSNRGNRCYLNSVLQLMLRQVDIKQRILDAFDRSAGKMKEFDEFNAQLKNMSEQPKSEDVELRQAHEQQEIELLKQLAKLEQEKSRYLVLKPLAALILHLEAQTNNDYSEIVDDLVDQIRFELFSGKFHNDLKQIKNLHQQQDAGILIEIMFKDLLENLMQTSTVDQAEKDASLAARRMTDQSALVVNFDENEEETPTLTSLIANAFTTEQITRRFTKTDGTSETTTASSQTRITRLPDTVAVHINRTAFDLLTGRSNKIDRDISLPHIVDLAPYCSDIQPGRSYLYQLVGYNVHAGRSVYSGHYTAYLMIGDKYFACDDLGRPRYREISKEEFYGEDLESPAQQAYLVMLKRIEAPVAGVPTEAATPTATPTATPAPTATSTTVTTKDEPKKNSTTTTVTHHSKVNLVAPKKITTTKPKTPIKASNTTPGTSKSDNTAAAA